MNGKTMHSLAAAFTALEDAHHLTAKGYGRISIEGSMMHVLSTIIEMADVERDKIEAEGFSV